MSPSGKGGNASRRRVLQQRRAPDSDADLHAHGYDYWALGHIHTPSQMRGDDGALIAMPGIPQGRHVGESGRGGAALVTIDGSGARAETIPLAAVAFDRIELNLSAGDQAAQIATIEAALAGRAANDHDVALRVILTGPGAAALMAEGDPTDALREIAAQVPRVHIMGVRMAPVPTALVASGLAGAPDLLESMCREIDEPLTRDAIAAMIADFRAKLPQDVLAAVEFEDMDAVIAEAFALAAARVPLGA